MTRKTFIPQLPFILDVTKLQYKLDDKGKEIKFSPFGKPSNRPVTKHKASGHGYKHNVGKTILASPTHMTQHARVVAEREKRSKLQESKK
jgi:hypothetical protein